MVDVDHTQAFELLPWLVNGTLAHDERVAVEAHVRDCVTCRIALREQQRLRMAVLDQPIVPLSAGRGFEELQRELDRRTAKRRLVPLGAVFAPRAARAAAALGVAAVMLLVWLATRDAIDGDRADYTTLTSGAQSGTLELDLIFAESVSENEMRALLNEIDGTIVGGPSDIGRYTVRIGAQLSEPDALALLQRLGRDPRVRFAGRALLTERGR